MPKRSKLAEAEKIGKALQERNKGPTEADYKRLYEQVQAGHLTKRQAAVELGTSKGDVYRKFKELEKSETASGAQKQAKKAKSPIHHVVDVPQAQEQVSEAESPPSQTFEIGIQYVAPDKLDNTRYQPRTIIKAPADLILDMRLRGGNIYPVIVQASTGAVVEGHRRVDAITKINQDGKQNLQVKCDIQDLDDKQAALLAYQGNVLTSPLSEGERDKWIFILLDKFSYTPEELSKLTGMAIGSINNIRLAFTGTTEVVREQLEKGEISTGVAKAVTSLPAAAQRRIVKKAVTKQLTVRQVADEASEFRGREEIRKKLHAHLYAMEPRLVGTIEVADREKWREKVLKDTFSGETWHRESGHVATIGDVTAAEKMLGITVVEKKVAIALCKTCAFEQDKKCEFGHKMPRSACEHHLLSAYPGSVSKSPVKCTICGGWTTDIALKGEKVGMEYHTHEACILARIIEKGGLSGVCMECSHACRTARSVIRESYDPGTVRVGGITKRVTVTECSEMKPKADIKALNERAEQRVMEAIAKFHRDDKTIAANHEIERGRDALASADLKEQVGKACAPEPTETVKVQADAGPVTPRGPAHFREDAEPAKEETA